MLNFFKKRCTGCSKLIGNFKGEKHQLKSVGSLGWWHPECWIKYKSELSPFLKDHEQIDRRMFIPSLHIGAGKAIPVLVPHNLHLSDLHLSEKKHRVKRVMDKLNGDVAQEDSAFDFPSSYPDVSKHDYSNKDTPDNVIGSGGSFGGGGSSGSWDNDSSSSSSSDDSSYSSSND